VKLCKTEVNNVWSYVSSSLCGFMEWCLINKTTNLLQPTRRRILGDNIFQHTNTLKFSSLLAYYTVTIVRFV
jgi:hypothetical protein